MSHSVTLDMPQPELVFWDGNGTTTILARGHGGTYMTPRNKAIAKALLLLAIEELEA